jgi:hypothetical protein
VPQPWRLRAPHLPSLSLPTYEVPATVIDKVQEQERIDELKAKFWSQEPITQQEYYVQAREDGHLIARISAGVKVSQGDLAEALKRIETDY